MAGSILAACSGATPKQEGTASSKQADTTCNAAYEQAYGVCLYAPALQGVTVTSSSLSPRWIPWNADSEPTVPVPTINWTNTTNGKTGTVAGTSNGFTETGLAASTSYCFNICSYYADYGVQVCEDSGAYCAPTSSSSGGGSSGGGGGSGGTFPGDAVSIAAAAGEPNRLDVFVVGSPSMSVFHKAWNGAEWTPSTSVFDNLSGAATGIPDVALMQDESLNLQMFVPGPKGQLFTKEWADGQWGPSMTTYINHGGNVLAGSRPSVVSWGRDRLDVFVVGAADNALYHTAWNGSEFLPLNNGYDDLGGDCAAGLKAISWGPNRIDVFVVGADNALHHKAWDGTQWLPSLTTFDDLGGSITPGTTPAVASWAAGRLDIFVNGPGGALFHKAWDGAQWQPSMAGYDNLGGSMLGSPAVASWGPNRLDVFVKGAADGAMYHKAWNGSAWAPPSNFDDLGGLLTSSPTVVSWGPNRLDVFVAGPGSELFHKAWNGAAWLPSNAGYDALGGVIARVASACKTETAKGSRSNKARAFLLRGPPSGVGQTGPFRNRAFASSASRLNRTSSSERSVRPSVRACSPARRLRSPRAYLYVPILARICVGRAVRPAA